MMPLARLAPLAAALGLGLSPFSAAPPAPATPSCPQQVFDTWYRVTLELVRHTPTYSPPVASRALAYLGVAAYESVAGGSDRLQTPRRPAYAT